MIFLDFNAADKVVRSGFDFLIDIFKLVVKFLKEVPTGFGVDLYHFFIACIITGVVVTGVVNIVRSASFVPHSEVGIRGRKEYKDIKQSAKRYDSDYESWFNE